MVDMKKIALFAAGTLFGSAGFKLLSSSDAKKVYTQTTAAVLRMKDSTMETVSKVQEQAGDILEDAKAINEARAAKAEAEVIEDATEAETTEIYTLSLHDALPIWTLWSPAQTAAASIRNIRKRCTTSWRAGCCASSSCLPPSTPPIWC